MDKFEGCNIYSKIGEILLTLLIENGRYLFLKQTKASKPQELLSSTNLNANLNIVLGPY